jgi:hypothetical protein
MISHGLCARLLVAVDTNQGSPTVLLCFDACIWMLSSPVLMAYFLGLQEELEEIVLLPYLGEEGAQLMRLPARTLDARRTTFRISNLKCSPTLTLPRIHLGRTVIVVGFIRRAIGGTCFGKGIMILRLLSMQSRNRSNHHSNISNNSEQAKHLTLSQ